MNEAKAETTQSKPKQETPTAHIEEVGMVTTPLAEGWITLSANNVAHAKHSQGVFDTGATIHCTPRFKNLTRCTLTRSLAGKRGLFSPSQRDHRKSIF